MGLLHTSAFQRRRASPLSKSTGFTRTWSTLMPFDGFVFGSRVMDSWLPRKRTRHHPSRILLLPRLGSGGYLREGHWGALSRHAPSLGAYPQSQQLYSQAWKEYDDTVFKLARRSREAWLLAPGAPCRGPFRGLMQIISSPGSQRRRMAELWTIWVM